MILFIGLVRLPGASWKYACRRCGAELASEKACLEIMGRPIRATYKNPDGILCEIVTLVRAGNLVEIAEATLENTWFEGYAWRPVLCERCGLHLGWRYETEDPSRSPSTFYGLLVEAMQKKSQAKSQT
jgi:hypothetical protein